MSRPEADNVGDFWSRRRAAVAAEEQAERKAEQNAQEAEARAALEEKSDEDVLAELGLKDPDTLEQGDDFSAFLKSEVPDRLRRRALRRLWRSNPVLANIDALVDYGEDFTDSATVVENLQTAYRVGKGMLAHIEKQLEAAEAKGDGAKEKAVAASAGDDMAEGDGAAPEPQATQPEAAEAGRDPESAAAGPQTEIAAAQHAPTPISQENQSEKDALTQEAGLPSPRRMRFVYGPSGEEST